MVPTLETIKGGGGSIKIGTTGTISALMSRELRTVKDASPNPISVEPNEATKIKARVQADEPSSSSSNNTNEKHGTFQKTKPQNTRKPSRNPNGRKGSYIVEVVDIKCRIPDNKPWVNPITNRLKKLNFSKLSETNGGNSRIFSGSCT